MDVYLLFYYLITQFFFMFFQYYCVPVSCCRALYCRVIYLAGLCRYDIGFGCIVVREAHFQSVSHDGMLYLKIHTGLMFSVSPLSPPLSLFITAEPEVLGTQSTYVWFSREWYTVSSYHSSMRWKYDRILFICLTGTQTAVEGQDHLLRSKLGTSFNSHVFSRFAC